MTRSLGGAVGSQDGGNGHAPTATVAFDHTTLPFNAPEVLAKNAVYVRDPHRIYSVHETERRKEFQVLVRRYIGQLLYGCQEPACTTPTCLSFRKRIADAPLRKLTAISARTVACYLASEEDPEKSLCPHKPVIPPEVGGDDFVVRKRPGKPDKAKRKSREKRVQGTGKQQHSSDGADKINTDLSQPAVDATSSSLEDTFLEISRSRILDLAKLDQKAKKRRKDHKKKDPKSFTQNLFDTFSMKMIEWLPLPSAASLFNFAPEGEEDQYSTAAPELPDEVTPSNRDSIRVRSHSEDLQTAPIAIPERDHTDPDHANMQIQPHSQSEPVSKPSSTSPQAYRRRSSTQAEQRRRSGSYSSKSKLSKPPKKTARPPVTPFSHGAGLPYSTLPPPARHHRRQQQHTETGSSRDVHQDRPHQQRRESWNGAKMPKLPQETPSRTSERDQATKPKRLIDAPHASHQPSVTPPRDLEYIRPPQALSHLSYDLVVALMQLVKSSDALEDGERQLLRSFGLREPRSRKSLKRLLDTEYLEAQAFTSQSIFYVLSSPETMLKSWRDPGDENTLKSIVVSRQLGDQTRLADSFQLLIDHDPSIVFKSLWLGIECLFTPPPQLVPPRDPRLRTLSNSSGQKELQNLGNQINKPSQRTQHVSEADAAHIVGMCVIALAAAVPSGHADSWLAVRQLRAHGKVVPDANLVEADRGLIEPMLQGIEALEDEVALRLVNRLVRAVAARSCFSEIAATKRGEQSDPTSEPNLFENLHQQLKIVVMAARNRSSGAESDFTDDLFTQGPDPTSTAPAVMVEWLRTVLLKEWDGKGVVKRWGVVGGAIEMLSFLYKHYESLELPPEIFHTPFLSDRLDPMETPVEWIAQKSSANMVHLLSYSFLFPPSALVTYFRAINFSNMSKAFETSMTTGRLVAQMLHMAFRNDPFHSDHRLFDRMKTAMSTYLVLEVRRDTVLTDALNQLWRREKRELMRPLKVRMGMEEGEEGVDHGGVQQEFFRLAISEALNPEYGLFTTDTRTRMSWFQPCSLEPLYKFELLGLLVSLAIYNGLTLPVTFPEALYRKLLGVPVSSISHIKDGWPELSKGLADLLAWTEGDVGDVFMRTYEFSVQGWGKNIEVDMEKVDRDDEWPKKTRSQGKKKASFQASVNSPTQRETPPHLEGNLFSSSPDPFDSQNNDSEPSLAEASLVTNANREKYVRDYIFWLTDKSIRPQYEAFARGLFVCLDKTALSIFTPEALRSVVEGIQEIDVDGLEQTVRYEDGFSPQHPLIQDFWHIVREFSADQKRKLLEFVTASDRVPVNGVSSILFVIQRNGPDSEVREMG
ncbi:MAG: hypothetical protein M1819_001766 [Sarea resinae]|nr:MAG: hypothetical protein M1819_001766 [Sarea resinae]